MENISFKMEKFNRHLSHARLMKQEKRTDEAKKYYRLAALEMYQIAQFTQDKDIKSARTKKADELMSLAEHLEGNYAISNTETSDKSKSNLDQQNPMFTETNIPEIGFDQIAGLDDLKEIINEKILGPFNEPDEYEKWGIKRDQLGIFLFGPPGTGKTMVAAAIAHELKSNFFTIKGSDILRKYQGESEERLSHLFKQLRQCDRAILFIDEIEALVPRNSEHEGTQKIRSELLQQLQGIDVYVKQKENKNKHLLIIAASNKPWDVDPAVIRSGRFGDYHIYVGLPDEKARKYIINQAIKDLIKIGEVKIAEDIEWKSILDLSDGYIVRDIEDIIEEAKNNGLKRYKKNPNLGRYLSMQDFLDAFSRKSKSVRPEDIKRLLDWRDYK